MKKNKKILVVVASIILMMIIYFGALHGEYHSSKYADGMRWTETQYFFGMKLWEKKGSDPGGLPDNPTDRNAFLGPARYWRGFGIIWNREVIYR
jgi:hypothetical protein